MNKLHLSLSATVVTLLVAAAPLLTAGPGPQFWKNVSTTTKPAPAAVAAPKPAATMACSQCQNCATCCASKVHANPAS